MKETNTKIAVPKVEGFNTDTTPDDRPSICVFGPENCGKTRFAATLPGPIGWIPLDKNSRRTADEIKALTGVQILMPTKPLLSDKEAIKLAMLDSTILVQLDEIKSVYASVLTRVYELTGRLIDSKDIQSVVVDTASQLNDWITFSHFGRKNQIKPTNRGAANQEFIDFINMLRSKNSVLVHRAAEIWEDTGRTDKEGNKIQEPSGKFKPDGFNKIGGFVTANLELTVKRSLSKVMTTNLDEDDVYKMKYRVKVAHCKGNTLLEGTDLHDYGVSGRDITWENVLTAIGVDEYD